MEISLIIIGIASVIVPLLIYIHSLKLQRRDTKTKAAKEKSKAGKLHTVFYDLILQNKRIHHLVVGIPLEDTSKNGALLNFRIGITNSGNETIKNVYLVLNFAPDSPLPISDEYMDTITPFPNDSILRKFFSSPKEKLITFYLKEIHPNTGIFLDELLKMEDCEIFTKTQVNTKDNVREVLGLRSVVQFHFQLHVTAENIAPEKYYFQLQNLKASNINELKKKYSDSRKHNLLSEDIEEETNLYAPVILGFPKLSLLQEEKGLKLFRADLDPETFIFYLYDQSGRHIFRPFLRARTL